MIRLFLLSCLAWLSCLGALYAQDQRAVMHTDLRPDMRLDMRPDMRIAVRIGVLAYRGSENLQQNWTSLQDYLNAVLPEWSFQIVPMTLGSASKQIETGQLEFVITNPGHFVELSRTHRMSVLASRSQKKSDGTYSGEFGSAIIARKGRDINGLQDIAGKSVMAIDQNAFGGFQLAWRECNGVNVDLFTDTSKLSFVGFPMDHIVSAVLAGDVDVGIVRSGLVEAMAQEGQINPDALVFLNSNVTYTHPDRVSTPLYPEWPFAALMTTASELKDRVTVALLSARHSPIAPGLGMTDMWSAPISYHAAIEVTDAFQARLHELDAGKRITVPALIWIALVIALFSGGIILWRRTISSPVRPFDATPATDKVDGVHLTRREHQILDLVAQGLSTKEIAIDLGISPKTVEFHRANLLRKFGARTSSQLVALAT